MGVFENGTLYYVRTDHIRRPAFATDSSGAKIWEASYLPFGGVQTTSGMNPDLRFPGQWFQSETGLHQNWMRDYDPTTGRYMQADPLGLVDGASVYGYALQNPGRYVDPRGEFVQLLPAILGGCLIGGTSAVFTAIADELINQGSTFEEVGCMDPGPSFIAGCIGGAVGGLFGLAGALGLGGIAGVAVEGPIENLFD